ncbi:hypothetical protein [Winogradskyella flava]|uniref:Uncharacterized protein n=1 Tax=Winogradskyella flava TaxID=1884876 RepID=A0A842IS82_9FLAO|nr:hypothetical protein [Winogradskyella flava]MBC2844633.1 hypothetical protein [Winogradskyella flava]
MIRKLYLYSSVCCLLSCEQLIEVEDISNEVVIILAPANNSALDTTTVNFTWELLEFAESYQLQVAKPNFDMAELIVEDTIITTTYFNRTLDIGTYQWRIKGINSAYQTQYTTQSLSIED